MHPVSPASDLSQQQHFQQRLQERLTAGDIVRFDRDGAICIKQLLTPEEVALLRDGIDANLAAPSPRAKVASRPETRAASSRTSATGRTSRSLAALCATRRWPWPRSA